MHLRQFLFLLVLAHFKQKIKLVFVKNNIRMKSQIFPIKLLRLIKFTNFFLIIVHFKKLTYKINKPKTKLDQ